MADIAATDLTYTQQGGSSSASPSNPKHQAVYSIGFGDGALTYPTGGIPLTKGKMGCPNVLESLVFVEPDADDGYVYKYDVGSATIRMYRVPAVAGNTAAAPLIEATSFAPDATVLIVKVVGW